tara:strand:+ start:3271 stop:4854 length:1584 start_codon:yes stop_codon:yes gene_type:complete
MGVESIIVNVVSNIGKIAKDTDKATKSLGGFKGAIKGIGTALKAAGIGLLLALMGKFFQLISKNQKVIDFFNTSMNALNIVVTDLINSFGGFFNSIGDNTSTVVGYFKEIFADPLQSVKDLGTAIEERLNESFESLIETLGLVGKAVEHLFKGEWAEAWESAKDAGKEVVDVFTGVDDSFDKIANTIKKGSTGIKDYINGTWEAAEATTELDKAVARAAATLDGINKLFAKNALEQQQIIDNELLSFEKRQEALNELTRLTEENNKANLEAAELRVQQAKDAKGLIDNEANRIALMKEENALMDAKAQKLAAEEELFNNKIELNNQWNERKQELHEEELQRIEDEKEARAAAVEQIAKTLAVVEKLMQVKAKQTEKDYEKEVALAKASGKSIEGIDKKYAAIRREEAKKFKAMKIAMAIVDTYQSAVAAYASAAAVPIIGYVLGPIAAGLAVAAGLANVSMIEKQPLGGGGGGGGGAVAQTPAPQMMSGAFELEGGEEVEPTQAYVVSDDITNSQNALAIIRRRATI